MGTFGWNFVEIALVMSLAESFGMITNARLEKKKEFAMSFQAVLEEFNRISMENNLNKCQRNPKAIIALFNDTREARLNKNTSQDPVNKVFAVRYTCWEYLTNPTREKDEITFYSIWKMLRKSNPSTKILQYLSNYNWGTEKMPSFGLRSMITGMTPFIEYERMDEAKFLLQFNIVTPASASYVNELDQMIIDCFDEDIEDTDTTKPRCDSEEYDTDMYSTYTDSVCGTPQPTYSS